MEANSVRNDGTIDATVRLNGEDYEAKIRLAVEKALHPGCKVDFDQAIREATMRGVRVRDRLVAGTSGLRTGDIALDAQANEGRR